MNSISTARDNADRPQRWGLVIFALVTLFLPNVNLIDILPDFIGYLIIFLLLTTPMDLAPHFEEARKSALWLTLLNAAKLPALLIITAARSKNTMDYDIVALFSLVFAIGEIIITVQFINRIFSALFYLGQRSDAESLISTDLRMGTEGLKVLTYVFAITKCALYALPETLRLTRNVDLGGYSTAVSGSRFYPWAVLISVLISTVIGSVWLSCMVKYVRGIRNEGKFRSALMQLASAGSLAEIDKKKSARVIWHTYLFFIAAAITSFDVIFTDYKEVNLMPPTIAVVLLLIGAIKTYRVQNESRALIGATLASGIGAAITSTVGYIATFAFLTNYGYSALLDAKNTDAQAAYITVEYIALAECVFTLALYACILVLFKRYTEQSFGIPKGREDYRSTDKAYHAYIFRRTAAFVTFGFAITLFDLVNVFSKGDVQLIFTNPDDVTMPVIEVASMPWLPTVILLLNAIYVLYAIYYFNFLKEEKKAS